MKNSNLARTLIIACLMALSACATQQKASYPTDFNGMWFVTEYDEIKRPNEDNAPFTEETIRRQTTYQQHFDPVTESAVIYCNPIGMPWAMLARARDYPREVFQTPDRIVIFFEYMDESRNIYLNQTEVPDNWVGSSMGYSLGRWEGDELVVETSGYTESSEWSMLQRSEEAKTIERWRRYTHPEYGDVIEVDIEVDDPGVYTEIRHGRALWKRGEPGTVINSYDCPGTVWEEYVSDRLSEAQ